MLYYDDFIKERGAVYVLLASEDNCTGNTDLFILLRITIYFDISLFNIACVQFFIINTV